MLVELQEAKLDGAQHRRWRAPAATGWAALSGAAYLLTAWLALTFAAPEGVAQFWPAAGVAAGALIVLGRSSRLAGSAAVAAASLIANGLAGYSALTSIAFALGNVAEPLTVAALIAHWSPGRFKLGRLNSVLGLFAAAMAASAFWQAVTAIMLELTSPGEVSFLLLWGRLLWSNLTGIVTVAPLVIAAYEALRKPPPRRELLEGAAVLALLGLSCLYIFGIVQIGPGRWLLLAPFTSGLPLLLWLSVRCGPLFAASGSLALGLSVLGSFASQSGRFADTAFDVPDRLLAMHYAILVMAFVALAITALIAERREAEESQRSLLSELEDKNAELERFVYTVSHDLKSPLITIQGFSGMLEQSAAKGDTARMLGDVNRIRAAAAKMQMLLDDLLELSRIGRLVKPRVQISLTELAREAAELVAGQAASRGVQIDISPGLPTIVGDRQRLLEVLQNLLDNAIKFMGGQRAPRVEIGAREEGGETICFVRDNGIGIDPRYQGKIFGLFERLDQTTEGTGVGLAIVKRVIEGHGGRIWVESAGPGRGCAFYFSIPAMKNSSKPEA